MIVDMFKMTLVEELYCAMVEVGACARRIKLSGPLARTLIDTAPKSLDLWRQHDEAAMRFATMVLMDQLSARSTMHREVFRAARPLTSKLADEVAKAFTNIYKDRPQTWPKSLMVDDGHEFKGAVSTLLSKHGVRVRRT